MPSNIFYKAVAAGAVGTGAGEVGNIILVAGDAAAAYVDLRDAAAGSGTKRIVELKALTGTTVSVAMNGLHLATGAYAEAFTGTGAVLYVEMI